MARSRATRIIVRRFWILSFVHLQFWFHSESAFIPSLSRGKSYIFNAIRNASKKRTRTSYAREQVNRGIPLISEDFVDSGKPLCLKRSDETLFDGLSSSLQSVHRNCLKITSSTARSRLIRAASPERKRLGFDLWQSAKRLRQRIIKLLQESTAYVGGR